MYDDQSSTSVLIDQNRPAEPAVTAGILPWGWRDVGKAVLLIILGTLVLSIVSMAIMVATDTIPTEEAGMAAAPLFALGVGIYAFVVLAVYLFAARRGQRSGANGWARLGWQGFEGKWIWALPLLVFVQFMGMAVANLLLVLPFVGSEYENPQIEAITGGGALSSTDLWLLMILIAVVAPLAEELFFRGMLYPLLRQRWSMWPSIIVNGLLFSLIHVLPPLLPGLFFVGVVLAWVREKSGSLIPCILLHALQNGIVLWGIYQIANGALT
jgi:membrane protease YdiL (CAAX protease family)